MDARHLEAEGPGPDIVGDENAALAEYPYSIYNHGTWTAEDDRTLIQARTRGQNWADLQRTHFPTKTANACRKRYERLVERRGIHDYSGRRLEMVANEYMNMRKEIWSPLADRLGMKWEVVEALVGPCLGILLYHGLLTTGRTVHGCGSQDDPVEREVLHQPSAPR
jgi:hypothetical protein